MTGAQLQAFRAKVQSTMESLQPCTVVINGSASIPAATSGLRRGSVLSSRGGGFEDDDDIKFRIRKSLLPDMPPAKNGRITWVERSLTFKITHVSDGGDTEPAWLIGCIATNEL